MNTYEIDYLAKKPLEWETKKFRQIFNFYKGLGITKDDLTEEGVPVISYGQVHSKDNSGFGINDSLYRFVSENYLHTDKKCLVKSGDFIFADTSEDHAGVGNCAYVDRDEDIFAGYHSIVATPVDVDNYYGKYFAFQFMTDFWRSQLRAEVMGIKVFSITQKILRNTVVMIPSKKEQQAIADFLDDKCRQIPEHWEVKRLKYVMDNFDNLRKPIEATERTQNGETLYDYYGASGVIDKIDNYIIEGDKLLIGEDGANLVTRNLPLIYLASGKYWVNNHAHILYPKGEGSLHYFAHQMEIIDYTLQITGSAQPKLNQENLNNVFLVVPISEEQQQIADFLDAHITYIDDIVATKQTQLTQMQQHKKSLIYEYVTGKKRVGGFGNE